MKSVSVAAFCIVLAVSYFKECDTTSSSFSDSEENSSEDVQEFGISKRLSKIGCLASVRRIRSNRHKYMCDAALISMMAVLAVRYCVIDIPTIGIHKFSIWVGEGLDGPYTPEDRARSIEDMCFDGDIMDPRSSHLAIVIMKESGLIRDPVETFQVEQQVVPAYIGKEILLSDKSRTFRTKKAKIDPHQEPHRVVETSDAMVFFDKSLLYISNIVSNRGEAKFNSSWGALLFSPEYLVGIGMKTEFISGGNSRGINFRYDYYAPVDKKKLKYLEEKCWCRDTMTEKLP